MIAAGIDVGSLSTKVVLLNETGILSSEVVGTGIDAKEAAKKAMDSALKKAGKALNEVESIMSTGAGKKKVPYDGGQATEVVCGAKGVRWLYPKASGVIDIGAESCRAVKCDPEGNIVDFALNDKCASGTGIFLDAMAKALRVKPEEMGELSLKATQDIDVTSMCSVFAESEVVSMIHRRVPKNDILRGIHKSIASRICGLANRILLDGELVVVGGIAQNVGLVTILKELMKAQLIVPKDPEIVSALGAAILARERRESK